jgi:hypothetical protein
VANYLDHLLAVDEYIRPSPSGCVMVGYEMHEIARRAGLVGPGDQVAANWTGVLVELGYLTHDAGSAGDNRPDMPGRMWSDRDLQRYGDYRLTKDGRSEADQIRRQQRERRTDAAIGLGFPNLTQAWMNEGQNRAVMAPLASLQAALDGADSVAAIGAAKDLVEAACKVQIESRGESFARGDSLPDLFKATRGNRGGQVPGEEVAKSLAATVQRLAELRNAVGAGHGQASVPSLGEREGRLAASAGCAVAAFVLEGA